MHGDEHTKHTRPPLPSRAFFSSSYLGQAVLVRCLRRLRVVRPAGLFELLAAIEVLRFELEHRPAVVVVDGMGSFFWQDKVLLEGDAVGRATWRWDAESCVVDAAAVGGDGVRFACSPKCLTHFFFVVWLSAGGVLCCVAVREEVKRS